MQNPFVPTQPIQLRLLGGLDLQPTDTLTRQSRATAVLIYLALKSPDRFLQRSTISTLFWPEQSTNGARGNLRNVIGAIRAALGAESILGQGDELIKLNRDVVWVDATALEVAAHARQHARVLELYQGDLLEGFSDDAPDFEDFMDGRRRDIHGKATDAALALAKECAKDAAKTKAIDWARYAANLAHLEENVVENVMEVLGDVSAFTEALLIYDTYERRLLRELGVKPGPGIQQLAERLRQHRRPNS